MKLLLKIKLTKFMKQLKILPLLLILSLVSSCGTISEGFKSPKQNKSDEFLVEKKSPLVMPPNFDELPTPVDKIDNKSSNEESIETLIKKNPKDKISVKNSTDLESSVIEKIKNN
tara:strand:+ start:221 stop:565 length:345 start_codon:yes stop_codon:yes gene_type:complete